MNLNTLKIASLLLLLFALTACQQEDPIEPNEASEPLVELQFSASPIDLQGVNAQFAHDVPYDQYDKTSFDIFLPESEEPTGLVIFIHGGGFTGGDKAFVYQKSYPEQIVEILNSGVAVATLNYRLIEENDTEGSLPGG